MNERMMPIAICYTVTILLLAPLSASTWGQSKDSVFLKAEAGGRGGVLRGKITEVSPEGVTIKSGSKTQQVAPHRIKKITYAGEPSQLGRARDRLSDGRYADCLAELAKIEEPGKTELIQQEIDFMKAYCNAQISLHGGTVTAQQAGRQINDFIRKYPDSFHRYPALELMGRLLVAVNKPDLAANEFAKLAQSQLPQVKINGLFHRGQALILAGQLEEAKQAFETIATVDATDDASTQFKLLAQAERAKVLALGGDPQAGQAIVEKIIADESADNSELFAYAYNALGTCHLKAGRLMDAALAFLHTQLLYPNEAEPHAEALYQLAKIWPQLEYTDRANRARQILKTRYRNSYWAQQL